MSRQLLRRNLHSSHGRQQRIVADRSTTAAGAGEYFAAVAAVLVHLAQNSHGLSRQRNDMLTPAALSRLPDEITPFLLCKIELRPLGIAQLAWSDENERSEPQRAFDCWRAVVPVEGPQDRPQPFRV